MRIGVPAALARVQKQSGQAMVQMAMIMTAFFGLVGAGIDWGAVLIEDARIQNAADAAALAGVRALALGGVNPTGAATTAATGYLTLHGYTHGVSGTTVSITYSSSLGTAYMDTITIQVDKSWPAYFWRMFGVQNLSSRGRAVAMPGSGLVDVMLSLDLTGSMELSGTNDIPQLQQAVADFVTQMNPDPAQPLGPKVGIARFAGKYCSWMRNGDGDTRVEQPEYMTPCYDDKGVMTNLTFDKATLLKIANNSGAASCPGSAAAWGCPLDAVKLQKPPQLNGTPIATPNNYPAWTGTKLPNGVSVVKNISPAWDSWATANGGRNGAGTDPFARKALVMITDGQNQVYHNGLNDPQGDTAAVWDTSVVTLATTLKLGADGIAGTADDVDVYTVGFFCTPYSTSGSSWCKSRMADTTAPHPCPNAVWNAAAASAVDTLLKNVSSSSAGSCDKFYPIKKTENLPYLFQTIAGAIARGRLSS